MTDQKLGEIRDLLTEIRDLLRPVADAYQDNFENRRVEREAARRGAVRAVLSTESRRRAWDLADGSRTQREIARAAGIDEGAASKLFKVLRELGALSESGKPNRTLEL